MNKYDIVIVGGGLIGLSLSYFLGKLGLSICIIDKNEVSNFKNNHKDYRTTAIAEGTKIILEEFGIWKKIKKNAEPIKNIKVIDRTEKNKIFFKNPKYDHFLGYIVENKFLKKTLINELSSNKKIKFIEKSKINKITISNDLVFINIKQKIISASLLVAADGRESSIKKILKEPSFTKKYNQSAIVINFAHSKDHYNIAYEIFYDHGPLATLPMLKGKDNNNNCSLVWSHESQFINNLYMTNNNFLSSIIYEHVGNYLGKITRIFNKQIFPLSAHINSSFGFNRVVFVGDAAHSIHPIAGQGWNLGMRDVNSLTTIINQTLKLGVDLGSDYVCKQYHNSRYFDVLSLYQITDKLNTFFMLDGYISKKIRNFGFNLIDSNKTINSKITKYAMGHKL